MADIQRGYSFSGSSPNNQVTAEKLNTLVDASVILPGFYTDKPEVTEVADADYLLVYDTSAGAFRKVLKSNAITSAVSGTYYRNLVAFNNAASPSTKIDVTATEILMRSAGGNLRYAVAFSATGDIALYSSGSTANGRDFASQTGTDRFIGVWAISDGTNDRLLLSTSNTPGVAPTLPSGCIYYCLLTVVFLSTSGLLPRFYALDNEVAVQPATNATTTASGTSTGANPTIGGNDFTSKQVNATSRTFSSVSLTNNVPTIATKVKGIVGLTANSGTISDGVQYAVASKGTGALNSAPADTIGLQMLTVFAQASGSGASFGFFGSASFEVPVTVSQTISLAVNGNGSVHSMRISGYTIRR